MPTPTRPAIRPIVMDSPTMKKRMCLGEKPERAQGAVLAGALAHAHGDGVGQDHDQDQQDDDRHDVDGLEDGVEHAQEGQVQCALAHGEGLVVVLVEDAVDGRAHVGARAGVARRG